jgi:O-antigen/teichoic acid export membrane protein
VKRTFITNLILLVGLNLLVKPFYLLVVEAEIQNRVGPETFGSYFALINFSFILNILPDLGTTNWNTRKTAQDAAVGASRLSRMLVLRLLLALLYMVVAGSVGFVLGYNSWQMFILVILAVNQVLASTIMFLRSYLTGLHLFRQDSIVSVLDRLLLIFMMGWLLWNGPATFRIEWLVWGQALAYGLTCIVALWLVFRRSPPVRTRLDMAFIRLVLAQSLPFALLILLSMIVYRVDTVMLERLAGPYESGIYAMGFRFFEAVNMIAYLFGILLLPIFTRMLKRQESISSLLQLGFRVLFSGIFIVAVYSFFFSESILGMVYDFNLAAAAPVFSWLMLSALFFSLQYVFGTLITASGDMRPMIYIALGGMVYNIALNAFYIPAAGAHGAAVASCLTQFFILVAQVAVVKQRFDVGDHKQLVVRTLLFSLICVGMALFFSRQAIFDMPVAYSSGLFLVLSFIAAIATRMLDVNRFIALIKSREEAG